jgi:uncharacterized repeat protein (TIGR01451 family)
MLHTRRRTLVALTSLLVPLAWLLPSVTSANAAPSAPVLEPDTTINGCNGVLPTPGSENTTKRLDPDYPSDFNPGGSVGYIIDFPVSASDVGGDFEITDCVYVNPPGAAADAPQAKYFIHFVPNNTDYHLRFSVDIPDGTPMGSQVCNYAKTTASPSASQASNRKAGPACFTVGGALRVEKRAGSATGDLLPGASFSVVCSPTTTLPPTIITGLSNASGTNPNGTVSASGVAADGSIAINGPSGTPCTVTETAAPSGYVLDATPRNLVIPVGASQTISVFVNQQAVGALVVQKSTNEDGTFHFDVDCTGTAYDTTLTITTSGGSGSASISGIPTGTSCTVAEQTNPLFSSSVDPTDGTVTIARGDNTVSFSNTRLTGSLVIDKTTDVDGTFSFDIDCDGTAYDSTGVMVSTSEGSGTRTITGIPTGTSCTVTENHDSTWAVVVTPADGTVTIGSSPVTVAFDNTKLFTDVSFSKSAVPASGTAVTDGDTITYSIGYANAGNIPADVSITDTVPAGTTFVDGSAGTGTLTDGTLTWNVTIPAGGSGSVSFAVTVNAGLEDPTTIHNVAAGHLGETVLPTNATDHPVAHIAIVKSVDKTSAKYGDSLTYTLTVTNPSAADLTGVVVTDALPAGTSFVSASDGGSCDSPCTTVSWPAVDLASDGALTRSFVVTIDTPAEDADGGIPGTVITNVAQVDDNETPAEPSNEVRTNVTTVLGVKVVKPPVKVLPFTGSALPLGPTVLVALAMLVGGLGLTWSVSTPRRRGQRNRMSSAASV